MNHCLSPLEDDDLLQEILLRLPPEPSSFPHASLVCKHWRGILSDPRFICRFRKHHRKTTLIGFFDDEVGKATVFTSLLDMPDRIPVASFALPEYLLDLEPWGHFCIYGCRDGIALFLDHGRREAVLWDPLSGVQRLVSFPPRFRDESDDADIIWTATVLCPAGDNQHVHGNCHMSLFKLVFACHDGEDTKALVCVYESKSGVWGNIISTTTTYEISIYRASILVGNALCWLLDGGNILEFDFERLALSVIEKPADAQATDSYFEESFQILRVDDDGLGLAVLSRSKLSIQFWARKSSCDSSVSWVLQKTVQLDELFSRPLCPGVEKLVLMLGYDEDTNVIFLSSASHDFILQIESMEFFYIGRREYKHFRMYYPYTRFCTSVRDVAGGDGGAENLNS